jgi:hypothetical protein
MASTGRKLYRGRHHSRFSVASAIEVLSILASSGLVGCLAAGDLAVAYTPLPQGDWKYEGAINRLVGRFIKSLPKELG